MKVRELKRFLEHLPDHGDVLVFDENSREYIQAKAKEMTALYKDGIIGEVGGVQEKFTTTRKVLVIE